MKKPLLILLFSISFFMAVPAEVSITNLDISSEKGHILFSFDVADPFQGKNLDKLKSGLEVSFIFQVEVRRIRKLLPDARLLKKTFSVNSRFRPQDNSYTFTLLEDKMILTIKHGLTLEELQEKMTSPGNLSISTEGKLQHQEELILAVRAVIDTHYILSIIPSRTKTPWREKRFIFRQKQIQ